ncbi:MAG: hypothetical protein JSW29_01235 [Candidatus Bathyarchaeota archaeon]|nr:MAG: hypothetical protein JSW29_01235 [Candidatus Bathyarchaeota archaeon]
MAKDENKGLGWKDYVALFIAMLTTTFLPLVIIVLILLVALLVLILLG